MISLREGVWFLMGVGGWFVVPSLRDGPRYSVNLYNRIDVVVAVASLLFVRRLA